jgi:hypothetical protein
MAKGKTVAINTQRLGRLTYTSFNKLVKAHGGNQTEVARVLSDTGAQVAPGTVRKWGERLRAQRELV